MQFLRRQFLHLSAGAGALLAGLSAVRADNYPSRPVRFIVGFPAGNASDVLARLMGQGLSDRLAQKQTVRVCEDEKIARGNVVGAAPAIGDSLTLLCPLGSKADYGKTVQHVRSGLSFRLEIEMSVYAALILRV